MLDLLFVGSPFAAIVGGEAFDLTLRMVGLWYGNKPGILDAAFDVLRRGDTLTIAAVARDAGLTKPGVVHHFATKEVLMMYPGFSGVCLFYFRH